MPQGKVKNTTVIAPSAEASLVFCAVSYQLRMAALSAAARLHIRRLPSPAALPGRRVVQRLQLWLADGPYLRVIARGGDLVGRQTEDGLSLSVSEVDVMQGKNYVMSEEGNVIELRAPMIAKRNDSRVPLQLCWSSEPQS